MRAQGVKKRAPYLGSVSKNASSVNAPLRKAKRVVAWCLRFVHNCKSQILKIQRRSGPLATEDVEKANNNLIIKTQEGVNLNSREAQKLGLTLFNDGFVRCIGRI